MAKKHFPFTRVGLLAAVFTVVIGGVLWWLSGVLDPPGAEPEASRLEPKAFQAKDTGLPATTGGILTLLQSGDPRLPSKGIQAALAYLKKPVPAQSAEDPQAEYFNNVIAILFAQPSEVVGLSETLLSVVDDTSLPLLIRDYAMQHFYHAWSREKDMVLKRKIESHLKRHFEDASSPLQGVALLTTSRLFDQDMVVKGPNGEKLTPIGGSPVQNPLMTSKPSSFSGQDFVTVALRVTEEKAAAANARTCAFNVLLRLEVNQAAYPARKILQEKGVPDEVRCAALASLGAFGDLATDQALLEAIPVKPELVRTAANHALRKLQQFQSNR